MIEQLQLSLRTSKAPIVDAEDVRLFLELLSGSGWLTAKEVTEIAKERGKDWRDRYLRALASGSEGQIISGQNGYRLTKEASIEEVQHAANWLRHQATEMQRRAFEIDRQYHKKL